MSRPTANLRFFSTIFIYRDFVFMDLANGCGSGRMFFVKMYGVALSPAMPMRRKIDADELPFGARFAKGPFRNSKAIRSR